jgi:uncharacterized protein (DUF983 family)
MVICGVVVYGVSYLFNNGLDNQILSHMTILMVSIVMTMATMFKKLKDDLVSNYWKLRKFKETRKRRP